MKSGLKRFFSLFMCVAMFISVLPMGALAEELKTEVQTPEQQTFETKESVTETEAPPLKRRRLSRRNPLRRSKRLP